MKIDNIYHIEEFPFNLKVIQAIDFEMEPILLLERDTIGNNFLSYLYYSDEINEHRAYLQLSDDRLNEILANELTLKRAFSIPETNLITVGVFALESGVAMESFMIPSQVFEEYKLIPEDYEVQFEQVHNKVELDKSELLQFSERKQKIVLDFYLQSENLLNNIKPYAIYKILTPVIEIIKSMLEFDSRTADKHLAFSNFRQGSLGVTIEVNYSHDLFLEKESEALEILILLLNAQEKNDFESIISRTKNEKYLKYYKSIIKSIIDNDAYLHTAYANPISKIVQTSLIDKKKALVAREVIDETLEIIEDTEVITGTFLEIDVDRKQPSFKIHSSEEDFTVKGKFELSLLEKVKNDFINIGKENYSFTIKTIYHPETTLKSEEINRFLIDYKKL